MKEGLQKIDQVQELSFTARVSKLFVGETGLLHWRARKAYKERREEFIDCPFSPEVRRELFQPQQPENTDQNIIEGEFRETELPQLSEPFSSDK